MENKHELSYETLTRVYLGSYEHYKGVVAEVEHSKPGFELQGSKMVEMGHFGIIREQRIAAYNGYEIREWGMKKNEVLWLLFIGAVLERLWCKVEVDGGGFGSCGVRG
ncbi:hypothetical protein Tco_0987549 [Tanacetum coccineum]